VGENPPARGKKIHQQQLVERIHNGQADGGLFFFGAQKIVRQYTVTRLA